MQTTALELAATVAGMLGFAVFLLPPGYLFAWLTDLQGFRKLTLAEQALWSLTLSFPLALLIANLLGRKVTPAAVLVVFADLALVAGFVLLRMERRRRVVRMRSMLKSRQVKWAALAVVVLAGFCVLALLDVQVGRHVFVPATIYDWAVRVPMVRSAMVSAHVPPLNPLSSLHGEAVRLRYYYFWYVLCALPARLLGLSAHTALAASAAWSAAGFLAVMFLAMKYMVGEGADLKRRCLWMLLPLATIGLDIVPSLAILLGHQGHPFLDMEWWRNDRTPSFLTSMLFSPHHIAGIVCCVLGFLIVVTTPRDREPEAVRETWGRLGIRAAAAGMCFGACAGASTFACFLFTIACLLWAVDLARSREWRQIGMLAAVGVVSIFVARPFLHDLTSTTSQAGEFCTFAWRSSAYAQMRLAKAHLLTHSSAVNFGLRQVAVLVLDFFELGFFFFVLVDRAGRDLRRTLTPGERALWAMFGAAALVALFLSSSVTGSANDLGMSAGGLGRLVLVLWAAPWLQAEWERRRLFAAAPRPRKVWLGAAAVCLVLGVAGQAYGLITNRFYFPMLEYGVIRRPIDLLTADRTSERIYNIRAAYQALDRMLPEDGHIQFDPVGTMQPVMSFYANRQIASAERGCGTAFGGDAPGCAAVWDRLSYLYGMSGEQVMVDKVAAYAPAAKVATVLDMTTVCSELHLSALLVESTDPIWNRPGSWVWTERPIVENGTVRIFACPPRN